jgi:hypothetical protein
LCGTRPWHPVRAKIQHFNENRAAALLIAYQVGMIEGIHTAPVTSFDRFSVTRCGWLAQAIAPRTLTLSDALEGDGDG